VPASLKADIVKSIDAFSWFKCINLPKITKLSITNKHFKTNFQFAEDEILLFYLADKLRGTNNLFTRGLKNTPENFADFCCEVGQLLCRSLSITHEMF
jgi:hypothetical protein